ncbi:hypothetical protein [Amycolatopsis samaneae]|uniref:Uncharacterized protein n=1 Tax=Amycolatopsis samaneae TaxID=664691 RepID=A0ABW5GAW1_9PSEU
MWSTFAVTNDDYAARSAVAKDARRFRARAVRAREHSRRLQLLADHLLHTEPS